MKITVVAVGKLRLPACRSLCDEYRGRIGPAFVADEVEVKEGKGLGPREALVAEAPRIEAALPAGCRTVVLDEGGREWTTVQFARWLGDWRDRGLRDLRFVVGGAWGIAAPIRAAAHEQLSLSRLTLPHELARVVLWEQLYRATTVLAGSPYHHEGKMG